jgi:uncharacterized membrane protein YfcA
LRIPEWLSELINNHADERLVIVALAVFLAGFLRGFVGFGAALVSVPIISLMFGPLMALPIMTVMGLPSTFQLLPDAVRHSEWPIVGPIAAAVFIAAPFGTLLLVSLDPGLMKIVISGLVIVMVGFLAMGWRLAQQVPPSLLILSGTVGGLVQGAAGIGGPPVVAVALSRDGNPERQRGNVLAVMTAIALSAVPPLYWHGLFTTDAIVIGLALVPIYSFSTWIGSRYFRSSGQQYFRSSALAVLLVIGVVTLVFASLDYLRGS